MKKILLSIILLSLTACATTKDIESLQSQIDDLKTPIASAQDTASAAKLSALNATTLASQANYWAVAAEGYSKQINLKLDEYFKQTQLK